VFVEFNGQVAARFAGENENFQIDGRAIRWLQFPDVYRQWVHYWRSRAVGVGVAELANVSSANYRLNPGGEVSDIGASSAVDVATYLYSMLVSEGRLREALTDSTNVESDYSSSPTKLSDEIEGTLVQASLLESDEAFVAHPVRRSIPVYGKLRVQYKPAFVQQNGRLYVMEAVDFTHVHKNRALDHAGWSAYMFRDIRAAEPAACTIAVVRVTEEDQQSEEAANGLTLLRNEGQVVNWLDQRERETFLEERRVVALS
jgi:hypothetical protein